MTERELSAPHLPRHRQVPSSPLLQSCVCVCVSEGGRDHHQQQQQLIREMEPEGRGEKTTPPLCAEGCGFFGNPATRNLCTKCYNALLLREVLKAVATTDDDGPAQTKAHPALPPGACGAAAGADAVVLGGLEQQQGAVAPRRPRRCDGCRRKVGLLGFECRCGGTFCGAHRHPEQHRCTFDFGTAGREAIDRANPFVKADKLQRI